MERESMLIYKSFVNVSETLNDEDYRKFWTAIFRYGLYGEEIPEFDNPVLDSLMVLIIPLIKANVKNYLNGCKGGAPSESMKGNQNARKNKPKTNRKQTQNKGNVTVNVTDTVNDTVTATEKEKNPFVNYEEDYIIDFQKYNEWNLAHGIVEDD